MITYHPKDAAIAVYLESPLRRKPRRIGWIKPYAGGWRYEPQGSKLKGDVLPSIGAVKRSIEG